MTSYAGLETWELELQAGTAPVCAPAVGHRHRGNTGHSNARRWVELAFHMSELVKAGKPLEVHTQHVAEAMQQKEVEKS